MTTTRTETGNAALTYIRQTLSAAGHAVHSAAYWEDRGIKLARLGTGHAVAHCSTCYQAARRGGFTDRDAQNQGWHAEGFPHDIEQAAQAHYENTHAMEASR
jgi:hypothetical protein